MRIGSVCLYGSRLCLSCRLWEEEGRRRALFRSGRAGSGGRVVPVVACGQGLVHVGGVGGSGGFDAVEVGVVVPWASSAVGVLWTQLALVVAVSGPWRRLSSSRVWARAGR